MTDNQKEIKRLNFLVTKPRQENSDLKALIKESDQEDRELLIKATDILYLLKDK